MTTLSSLYGKGLVSDVAYPTGWDGETDIAPSKNTVYDEMENRIPDSTFTADGEIIVGTGAGAYQAESGATALASLGAMALTGANLAIGSDADGDMYYRASSVLAHLAKGAADTKLFMNAGATAPEWAGGMKIGTFTRDIAAANGAVKYSGIGFKPSLVIFISGISSNYGGNVGFDDGTLHYNLMAYDADTAGKWLTSVTRSIRIYPQDNANGITAYITATDNDSFTLTYIKDGSPTGTLTVFYAVYR